MTFHDPQRQDEASRIHAQLEAIEIERLRLVARLREIEREQKTRSVGAGHTRAQR